MSVIHYLFLSTAKKLNKRFLLDTPIIGLTTKPDCNGVTTSFHIGLPVVGEVGVDVHAGTDGVDAGASGGLTSSQGKG